MSAGFIFPHVPRPPTALAEYPKQRRFFTLKNEPDWRGVGGNVKTKPRGEVEFYRYADDNFARLSVSLNDGAGYVGVHLTAEELRDVARLCLDCAYDLMTAPAPEVPE